MAPLISLIIESLLWTTVRRNPPSETNTMISNPLARTIPGSANFTYCPESRETDLYQIDLIDAHPSWPPRIGDDFIVMAYGTFLKDVPGSATLFYDLSWEGWPTHFNDTTDFCDITTHVDQPDKNHKPRCPPEKGLAILNYVASIPDSGYIPITGMYHMRFDAKTKEGERIYCIENTFDLDWPSGEKRPGDKGQPVLTDQFVI